MVSATRFGALRFASGDDRGVLALSFTRAATAELARRVKRLWGPTCLRWPNRIETLDKLLLDLLSDLLVENLVVWPGGTTTLDVFDSWAALGRQEWSSIQYRFRATGNVLSVHLHYGTSASRVPGTAILPLIEAGLCTHDDVRAVMAWALARPDCQERVQLRLSQSLRAVIVDEVFDANELDLRLIEMMLAANVDTTLVGDPWQALYVFRGATPAAVPQLLARHNFHRTALTKSFRWRTAAQAELASSLRAGEAVAVEAASELEPLDVALSSTWKPLWELSEAILPLAFGSFKGGYEEAGATVLLNHFALRTVNEPATYLRDALRALAIDAAQLHTIDGALESVLDRLRDPGSSALRDAYAGLCEAIHSLSPRRLRPAHAAHTGRLKLLGARIRGDSLLIPGFTVHQAKGREWDRVGVKLEEAEAVRLRTGLRIEEETDRRLYVALTRARSHTVELSG